MIDSKELVIQRFLDSVAVKEKNIHNAAFVNMVCLLSDELYSVIKHGNKIILCGNGGSASDALHFAGEIVGRFQRNRPGWSAIVLNSDVATMTAVSNDFGYDEIFARQAEAHTNPGDLFIGISTSGNSENVLRAIKTATSKGAKTAALLGKDGGKIKDIVDFPVIVDSENTARIQESHICIIHILCEIVEERMIIDSDRS